jgi:RecA-family ATPase
MRRNCWKASQLSDPAAVVPQGLNHFLVAAREASAEVIVLDPLYSTHDQDENDTRSMAALCQSLLRLRDASKAALLGRRTQTAGRLRRDSARWEPAS